MNKLQSYLKLYKIFGWRGLFMNNWKRFAKVIRKDLIKRELGTGNGKIWELANKKEIEFTHKDE